MSEFTTRPTLRGTVGMVSTTHYLATAAGMGALERGGNAADAAVTAAFVLHVVEPHLNGPGGDAPILYTTADGTPEVLCGQGPAPAGATIAHYRDELGLDVVPGTGPLAAAIPGAFDAWMVLLHDRGTITLREALAPAIRYAEDGHDPVGQLCATVATVAELFEQHWPTSAAQWLVDGGPKVGTLLRNPTLAATWRRLVDEAEAASDDRVGQIEQARTIWRSGFIGQAIVAQAARPTRDASGSDHAGVLTLDDLAGWEAHWEAPVSASWGDWTVYKCGPWSQGPAFLQQLAMLADVEPGTLHPDGLTAEVVHRLVESTKLVFADRDAFYGDDSDVPLDALLSEEYAAQRRSLIGEAAVAGLRPGTPAGRQPRFAQHVLDLLASGAATTRSAVGVGEPTVGAGTDGLTVRSGDGSTVRHDGLTRGDTCHLDVVDSDGTMIAATPSGGWLQSNPTIPELGFCLGTRLQMNWLTEGLPSSLEPGRRPRTTLSPSIASFRGRPAIAFGTPGGDQQDQWSFHFFTCVADDYARSGRLELQAAIDRVNWHTDSVVSSFYPRGIKPNSLVIEGRADAELVEGLRARGHDVTVGGDWSEGRLCAVGRDPETGILCAAANPRGMQAYAAGR